MSGYISLDEAGQRAPWSPYCSSPSLGATNMIKDGGSMTRYQGPCKNMSALPSISYRLGGTSSQRSRLLRTDLSKRNDDNQSAIPISDQDHAFHVNIDMQVPLDILPQLTNTDQIYPSDQHCEQHNDGHSDEHDNNSEDNKDLSVTSNIKPLEEIDQGQHQ